MNRQSTKNRLTKGRRPYMSNIFVLPSPVPAFARQSKKKATTIVRKKCRFSTENFILQSPEFQTHF
jgi:hypothetical protein